MLLFQILFNSKIKIIALLTLISGLSNKSLIISMFCFLIAKHKGVTSFKKIDIKTE